jgi:predicted secreted protein
MFSALLLLALIPQGGSFDRNVAWNPPEGFREKVFTACADADGHFGLCFAEQMRKAGASPQVLRFTKLIDNDGYVASFRSVDKLAIALVNYPFRANENNGLLVLNGNPQPVNIDDFQNLPQNDLKLDASYAALLKKSPDASLWPGDRSSTDDLLVVSFPDGSQEFVASYRVQAGCHACAVLGQADFGFVFDSGGKFQKSALAGFAPGTPNSANAAQKMLTLKANSRFSILLPSNITTGYSWNLVSPGKSQNVENTGHLYVPPTVSSPGAGGEERWSFQASQAGTTTLQFAYRRPWEKNTPPIKTYSLTIHVR